MTLPEHSSDARSDLALRRSATSDTRAIETVLDAERAAEQAVADASAEAERQLGEARNHARRIGERADERIRRVHARATTLADQAIEQLYEAHEDRARESQRNLSNTALVEGAAARVAAWLLGEDDAGERKP